jgi:hypothetical protein
VEVRIGVEAAPAPAITLPESEAARLSSLVDLMMSVGHVDGVYAPRVRAFVRDYVETVTRSMEEGSATTAPELRGREAAAWRAYFASLEQELTPELTVLARESGPDQISPRLRGRVLTLFRGLSWRDRATALELIHALVQVDGTFSPAEVALYHELTALFAELSATAVPGPRPRPREHAAPIHVSAPSWLPLAAMSHPLLDPLEHTLSPHPVERQAQIAWDYQLVQRAMLAWYRQRTAGSGGLAGISDVAQLPEGTRFLDGFIHVMRPSAPLELIVLGDLHGCYSCLKAALLQSNFIERAWAHQWHPDRYPDVKLVLLGDYLDRGRFSFDGVLRAALQLYVAMPDQVILLRGNHEWLTRHGDHIASGVYPAEALASITGHVPLEMLEAYRQLFEHMPTAFVCDRTLLVHAGIPRADTIERYRDLASLNDPELRFQMMWSDPVHVDAVPVEVQRGNPRFAFGREQFRDFMQRTGMRALIRGHEQIDRGFDVTYDLGDHALLTLFSAGGARNADLPLEASYRSVTPMALTLQLGAGAPVATPWPIDYEPFNYEPHNGLYRAQPLLAFRYA